MSSGLILKMLEWASMNFFSFGTEGGFFTLDPTIVILTGAPLDCKSCLMSCRNLAASGPARQRSKEYSSPLQHCCVHRLQSCHSHGSTRKWHHIAQHAESTDGLTFKLATLAHLCFRLMMFQLLELSGLMLLVSYDHLISKSQGTRESSNLLDKSVFAKRPMKTG